MEPVGDAVNLRAASLGVLCATALWTPPARAQVRLDADADFARTRFHAAASGAVTAWSGFLVGGRAGLAWRRVALQVSYAQGSLSADTGGAASQDLVEGSVFASVRPTAWLALQVGPHLRAFVAPGGTERWVLWEGRAFAEAPILTDVLSARVGGWSAVTGAVNVGPGAAGARGGEAGLIFRPKGSPLVLLLTYRVDRETQQNGVGAETLEAVKLSLGFGQR